LMSNNISLVSPKTFGQLRRLQSVDLAGNFIRRIFPDTFSENSRLRTLSLSNNPIEAFDERSLRGLSSDLESLSLSYIPSRDVTVADSAFPVPGELTSLRRLDLDSSPGLVHRLIETDGGRLLDAFRAVRDLTLLSVEVETLPFDFFADKFPELTLLHLSSTR
jgi:Leucine-rich repeat (LRR) protein